MRRIPGACLSLLFAVAVLPAAAGQEDQVLRRAAQAAFDNGLAAAGRGDWNGAVRHFSDAEEAEPETPVILYNLGVACAKTGREDAAIEWWQAYLLAERDPANAPEIEANIDALEVAVTAKAEKVFSHALAEARGLWMVRDQDYAIEQVADSLAQAGNMQACLQLIGTITDQGRAPPGDDVERWKNYIISLYWARWPEKMAYEIANMPATVDKDALLAGYVQNFIDEGQFESADYLAAGIGDPALCSQWRSTVRDAARERDLADENLTPAEVKAAAVREWTDRAIGCTRRALLVDRLATLAQDQHYTGAMAMTVKFTLRDRPGLLARASGFDELLFLRGLRHKQGERILHMIKVANRKKADNDLTGAIAWYSRVIALNTRPAYYFERAECHRAAGHDDLAMEDYLRAIELNPRDLLAYIGLGAVKSRTGDFGGAIIDFDQALKLNPSCVAALHYRSIAEYEQGNFEEALSDSTDAITTSPNDSEEYSQRAVIQLAESNKSGALEDYARAIELDPGNPVARLNRSEIEGDDGDYKACFADLDAAIKANPNWATLYLRRGVRESEDLRKDEAIRDFDKALELNPNLLEAKTERAFAKETNGDRGGAYEDSISAGEARWAAGDLDGALADLYRAVNLDPESSAAHFDRALVEQTLGDFEHALVDYDSAIKGNSGPFAHLYRYLLLKRLGRPTDDDLANAVANSEDGFFREAGRYVTGQISLDDAIAYVRNKTPFPAVPTGLTRLTYYSGVLLLSSGDSAKARSHFAYCIWMKMKNCDEYEFADSELARMDARGGEPGG